MAQLPVLTTSGNLLADTPSVKYVDAWQRVHFRAGLRASRGPVPLSCRTPATT